MSTIEQTPRPRPARLQRWVDLVRGTLPAEKRTESAEEHQMDLTMTNLVLILAVGGLVGWMASILMKTRAHTGIAANIVVGLGGSLFGVFLANALGVAADSRLASATIAVVGASLLIAVLRGLGVFDGVAAAR
jgi:uncharacterized membrane protein YeaQ/YmgE (transglycosylase-associated protein family)